MGRRRTSSATELFVALRRDEPEPLFVQLERQLRDKIRTGRLPADSPLPSSRSLAAELGVSRGLVVRAYEDLAAEGYLCALPGGATVVATMAAEPARRLPTPATAPQLIDLRPGIPDLVEFPRGPWLRSLRRMLTELPSDRLGYLDARGVPELREELATYLNRVRGTATEPEAVTITSGFAQGMRVVAEALAARGARRIGVEDPSYPGAWAAIRAAGLEVVGIGVDRNGIIVDGLAQTDLDAILVTPAHQYPTGAVLPPARRTALLAWAAQRDGFLIEDDYDAEYRYDRTPVGAIHGLNPDRVIHIGTASKMLAPGLRLGWVLSPCDLTPAVTDAKRRADLGSPALDQLAFADLVASGQLAHHLRRMRPIYRRRRDALLRALAALLPSWTPVGASAGLHVLALLPAGVGSAEVVAAAEGAGVGLQPLTENRFTPPAPGERDGIVFGYGQHDEAAIERAIARVASVMPPG
jgi:GntR family transcriptional regulator/MocR family aminotransferase